MYPPDYDNGESDTCGCDYGKSCDYHREMQDRHDREYRQDSIRRGINPDAEVTEDLVEILFLIEGCDSLSRNQKDAIQRILFPI